MTYATLNQFKDQLGITDTSLDAYLSDLLVRVSSFIDAEVGHSFSDAETTVVDEIHEHPENRFIYLRNVDITAIDEVKTKRKQSDAWTTIAASTYDWTRFGRVELPIWSPYVAVSYKWNSPAPADIEIACLQLATDILRAARKDQDVSSERIGDYSVTYLQSATISASTSKTALDIVHRYRVRPI